jgi:dihydroneopterin aldolase
MTAKIGLEDVRIHAPHGFFEEEHLMGNEFSIDVEVEASIVGAAQNDDLGGTVNYATIYYLIQAEMKKPTQLLEALAYRMGNRILNQFDSVRSVKLRLRKLNPPLGGKVGAAVVEVSLDASSAGSFGGASRQDTYDDPGGFDDDDSFGGGPAGGDFSGGGFASGGFSGGGFSGGGISDFAPKSPPPPMPAFDDMAFSDADDDWDDDEAFDEDDGFDDEGVEFDIPDAGEMTGDDEVYDDEEMDGEEWGDGMGFDDLDLGDLDLGDFDINDLK